MQPSGVKQKQDFTPKDINAGMKHDSGPGKDRSKSPNARSSQLNPKTVPLDWRDVKPIDRKSVG